MEQPEGGGFASGSGAIVIIGLEGWSDAGEAASSAASEIARTPGGLRVVEVWDDERYFDYLAHRPQVTLDDSGERVVRWPRLRLLGPERQTSDQMPIYLLAGVEPSFHWRDLSQRILDTFEGLGIDRIVVVGSLLADIPHSRSILATFTSENAAARDRSGFEQSQYAGPTGLPSVIGLDAAARGMRAVSLWASVPHYTQPLQSVAPKTQLALERALAGLLEVRPDLDELAAAAEEWEEHVDEFVGEDEDLENYVHYLERTRDVAESDEASGDAIAAEFERYLAENRTGQGDDDRRQDD